MPPDESDASGFDAGASVPAANDGSEFPTSTVEESETGSRQVLGPYHLLQRIGTGGMGEVWLAEQKQPVRRRVAVKLIKAGMDTREVVARFESERQALALMDHPGIAKVFDAGSTPQGLPYFVMEYVAGIPITEYCDRHRLTTRRRLELFCLVCEGVQHAHQKAIIHRDLKPSNILVCEVDGKPTPRIIDFGVAKATSQRLTADTMFTQVGAILGTPAYMSPEQADSAGVDVDTRTDVYSLGVVLYELLVGALPLDVRKLPLPEVLNRLRNEDTPRPSAKARTLGAQSEVPAQNRGADVATLARLLKGDLDAITLKALEKDRSRRYATPLDLAADIGRYLNNEPVLARRAGGAYRARKYIRRHRVGVAVAAAGAVLLVAFGVAQALELRRITRERDRADRITKFMTGVFRVSNPSEARGNSVSARELLDRAALDIDRSLASDPELQARMMFTMARTYDGLGLYDKAASILQRAVEIQRRLLGPRAPDTLRSQAFLAMALEHARHVIDAEKLIRQTLDADRQVFGPEARDTLDAQDTLGLVLSVQGRLGQAEKVQRGTLDVQRRVLGPSDQDTLRSMNNLGATLLSEGRYADAAELCRQTIEIQRRALGADNPDTLWTTRSLADVLAGEGRLDDADRIFREVLAAQRRVLGPDHHETLRTMASLADTLDREGRFDESEKTYREVLAGRRRVLGADNQETLATLYDMVEMLYDAHRYAAAETSVRELLDTRLRVLGPHDERTIVAQSLLAVTLSHEKRFAESEKQFREAILRAGSDRGTLCQVYYDYACAAATAGHREDAFARLRTAIDDGYRDVDNLEKDPDLTSLRGDPRLEPLIAEARRNLARFHAAGAAN